MWRESEGWGLGGDDWWEVGDVGSRLGWQRGIREVKIFKIKNIM